MKSTRPLSWFALVTIGAAGLIAGCSSRYGGSIPYDAGYAVGSAIDFLLVQPSLAPEVRIEVVDTNTTTGTVTLKANADGVDLPLSYQWEQLEGQAVTISTPTAETTDVLLPVDAAEVFVFKVTVTDASAREGTDEIEIQLDL